MKRCRHMKKKFFTSFKVFIFNPFLKHAELSIFCNHFFFLISSQTDRWEINSKRKHCWQRWHQTRLLGKALFNHYWTHTVNMKLLYVSSCSLRQINRTEEIQLSPNYTRFQHHLHSDYLSTCHLSTYYATLPTSKMQAQVELTRPLVMNMRWIYFTLN